MPIARGGCISVTAWGDSPGAATIATFARAKACSRQIAGVNAFGGQNGRSACPVRSEIPLPACLRWRPPAAWFRQV